MKLHFQKEEPSLALPKSCLALLSDADAADLRVLLHIAACEAENTAFDIGTAAEALQLSEGEVRSSVKFWRGAGVLKADSAKGSSVKKPTEKKPLREKRATRLNTDELCRIAETDSEFTALLDMAQQTAGWIFNTGEIEIIARLYSELKLSGEYILAMIGCLSAERKSRCAIWRPSPTNMWKRASPLPMCWRSGCAGSSALRGGRAGSDRCSASADGI